MKKTMERLLLGTAAVALSATQALAGIPTGTVGGQQISHVLLISIDGMHAVDFANCAHGVPSINGGAPYCPNLAALGQTGSTYLAASTTRPSDSFPGMAALATGGTARTAGLFYDVAYDRALSPPTQTTPYGIVGGPSLCPGTVGTQTGFDEEIDRDYTQLNAGGGIDPDYLPRDPNTCAPVYPHNFIRVNTIFEVVKAHGGWTAWSDKHPSYDFLNGPSGKGLDDFYSPEINSIPVALPQVKIAACDPLPDQTAVASSNAWTDSFANIKCYDSLKVQAIVNEIDGKLHDGAVRAPVPSVFGMNFQAVSVGQKLVEKSLGLTGGYLDAAGTPSTSLREEIAFVDASIGRMVAELNERGLASSTLVVVTAKHGQSPIDPNRVFRIPADSAIDYPPSQALSPAGVGPGYPVVQADEDDISMLWLADNSPGAAANAVKKLESVAPRIGDSAGEIFSGPALDLYFNDPSVDSRTPNVIVAPNVGVTYTGGKKKVSEHGGFSHDDTNVMLLVSNPGLPAHSVTTPVTTAQVAPTILQALGLKPTALQAVRVENTAALPGL